MSSIMEWKHFGRKRLEINCLCYNVVNMSPLHTRTLALARPVTWARALSQILQDSRGSRCDLCSLQMCFIDKQWQHHLSRRHRFLRKAKVSPHWSKMCSPLLTTDRGTLCWISQRCSHSPGLNEVLLFWNEKAQGGKKKFCIQILQNIQWRLPSTLTPFFLG